MKLTDQVIKRRIVLITAALSLVGFFLEIGPVGAFSLANKSLPVFDALWFELRNLGFVAYLALAASAAIGLHMSETEPTPREQQEENAEVKPTGEGDAVGQRVRVRPEIHQTRMFFTALGGYVLLKSFSIYLMNLEGKVPATVLADAFQFGLVFVGLGWFVLWQFLRWFAALRRWVRLQDELVGGNVLPIIALLYLAVPVAFLINAVRTGGLPVGAIGAVTLLLYAAVAAAAIILWRARPYRLRRAVIALMITGGVMVALTIVLGIVELAALG